MTKTKANLEIDISLTPAQKLIDACQARFILVEAGRKFGKTHYSEWDILKHCSGHGWDGRGNEIVYIAPYRVQAKNIFWRRIKHRIPTSAMSEKPSESELSISLLNDIDIRLFGADNEEAARGINPRRVIMEEAAYQREGYWEEVIRPNLTATRGGALFISSPKGRNWYHKLYERIKNGQMGKDWAAFHFTIYDNPLLDPEDIEKIKAETPREIWEQEYMANPDAYSGQQYHEFDFRRHIIAHRNPVEGRLIARSTDWGYDHPSTCLWAEIFLNKETGRWNIYIFNEFGARGQNCGDWCTKIKTITGNVPIVFTTVCGSARKHEFNTGTSILSEFIRHGVPCTLPPKDDPFRVNAAKMMLKEGDVFISERCRNLIRELQEVEWGDEEGDDYADAFKYLCSQVYRRDFASYLPEQTVKNKDLPNDPTKGPIDPLGILANEAESDTIVWGASGYIS